MKFKKIISSLIIFFLFIFLTGCAVNKDGKVVLKKNETFKHDTPLIKTDVKKLGQKEVDKV
jgi:type IV pilus assembly protein PilQ